MKNIKDIISKYGFASLIILFGLILFIMAATSGQNTLVIVGIITVILSAALIALSNSGVIPIKYSVVFVSVLVLCSIGYVWLDYNSIQNKIRFIAEQDEREAVVVKRLIDIRSAQMSYKKLYGEYADNFNNLINHVKNDSMPVIKAIGFVPDSLTETEAVEMGIVTRDTLLISVRDTLFAKKYSIDSLKYVPFSEGGEFKLESGEIEKNKLIVKVFKAFASYEQILHGMNLSEEYIDLTDGLKVGSMTEPHTRGNWE